MQPTNIIEGSWRQGVPPRVVNLTGTAFMEEAGAHVFHVVAEDETGAEAAFTGTVSALFLRADNTTVAIDGALVDGAAEVTLVSDCYHVPGRFSIAVYVSDGTDSTCVYAAVGNVYRTSSETVIDSGATIPTLAQLQAAYADCLQATTDAEAVVDGAEDDIAAIGGRVNALHNLVDYGYGTEYSTTDFKRVGTSFWANHTFGSSSTAVQVFRLNGEVATANSNSGIDDFTGPVKLTVGNRYRLSVRQMSGTMTDGNGGALAYLVYPVIYTAGGHTATGTSADLIPLGLNSYAAEFTYTQAMDTAGGVQLCIRFNRSAGNVTTNWVAQVTLEDITDRDGITMSGTTPVINAQAGTRYLCGEVSTLSFTPSATGICDVRFTSGSTATVLTVPAGVLWPDGFDPSALEANTVYEINVSDGIYGAVIAWT